MNLKVQLKLYHILVAIKQNCRKFNIELYQKWYCFDHFLSWAEENGFGLNQSIKRINKKLGFSPSNCVVATIKRNNLPIGIKITPKGRYVAVFKKKYLGTFDSIEEAVFNRVLAEENFLENQIGISKF
jgi:hypothetical protein